MRHRIAGGLAAGVVAVGLWATPAAAQEAGAGPDRTTLDGIVAELYGVISGPAGERDWDRFQALFVPGAILMNAGPRPDSMPAPSPISPREYQDRAGAFFRENGFFESEIARTTHRYGTVAQLWSTYESRRAAEAEPFSRGINSIVAVRNGGRWWIASIIWDAERPGNPIPGAYLPGG